MKKFLMFLFCVILSTLFISCSNQMNNGNESVMQSEIQEQKENTDEFSTSENTSTDKKAEIINDSTNIDKIILSIAGQENEFPLDEDIKEFLNDIKTCNDIPETTLLNKIGSINIKYENGDEEAEYASLYIAIDNSVYAKYTTESQNDYAYKIDIDKLSESMGN